MELSNLDAIYVEYPFIETIYPRIKTHRASVSLWDKNFSKIRNAGSGKFYLLDNTGGVVTGVGGHCWPLTLFTGGQREETVAQAFHRIDGKIRLVCYGITRSVYVNRYAVHLYKLPKQFKNAEEWFNAEMKEDLEAIRQL